MKHVLFRFLCGLLVATAPGLSTATAADAAPNLPDGKAPDPAKKVQVFILLGQSNMLGMGQGY